MRERERERERDVNSTNTFLFCASCKTEHFSRANRTDFSYFAVLMFQSYPVKLALFQKL